MSAFLTYPASHVPHALSLNLGHVAIYSSLAILGLALWKAYPVLLLLATSKLKNLPGPPSPSWIYGNLRAIIDEDNSVPQERWVAEYGSTIMYRGFFGVRASRAVVRDTR